MVTAGAPAVGIGRDAGVRQLRTLFNLGTVGELTDGQLLEWFATERGEAAELAFAALVERHGPMVLRVGRGVLGDTNDAQDAFQATFLVLVKRARRLWVRDSLGPWLHQVAYRTASCARATAARHRRLERLVARSERESRPERDFELERLLHEEIDRLPERYRAPVVLCDLEGRTYEQAARHLGCPIGTVQSRLSRARQRLRDRLIRRGVAAEAGSLAVAGVLKTPASIFPPTLLDATTAAALHYAATGSVVRGSAVILAEGVLRTMSMTQWWKVATVLLVAGATASGAGWLGPAGDPATQTPSGKQDKAAVGRDTPTREVKSGKLEFLVSERGSVEPGRSQDLSCNVEGQTKIVKIVPEGRRVKKGDVIAELDSSALHDRLVNQQIMAKTAEVNFLNARLARENAQIALKEYIEGIYKQELQSLVRAIDGSRTAIRKIEGRLERTRQARQRLKDILAASGGPRTQADIIAEVDLQDRIDETELSLDRERRSLADAEGRREVLVNYTREKSIKELEGEITKAHIQELTKNAIWELEKSKEAKLEQQVAACTLRAGMDGIVVYAYNPRPRPGDPNDIGENATVHGGQPIASIVDVDAPMRINLKVHEAMIDRLAAGMKARVKVDAFSDVEVTGRVTEIAPRPDPPNPFNPDIKVYSTRLQLDRPFQGLRPGMTASADVVLEERDNAIGMPFGALVQYDGKLHVALNTPDGRVEWREVVVGTGDMTTVEVKEGLQDGDQVILDPLPLLSDEQRARMKASTRPARRKGAASRKGQG
jgi:RND family efflux transporter MFP subunit